MAAVWPVPARLRTAARGDHAAPVVQGWGGGTSMTVRRFCEGRRRSDHRSLTVAVLIGAARVSKRLMRLRRFCEGRRRSDHRSLTVAVLIGAARVSKRPMRVRQ